MNKLYWIVCDDNNHNIFEGRYQGRTRGEALKFLKQSLRRTSLNGLVFTITEIPVPLIREIVAECLANSHGRPPESPQAAFQASPAIQPRESPPEPVRRPAEPVRAPQRPSASNTGKKVGNPGFGDEHWAAVRAYWAECGSIREAAEHFNLSPNSVKTRARRERWTR